MAINQQTLAQIAIAAAGTNVVDIGLMPDGTRHVSMSCKFTYGSGGTTAKFFLQTSFDGGTTWMDVVNFAHTTASLNRSVSLNIGTGTAISTLSDGTLADNTKVEGIMGDRLRLKYIVAGTYGGSTTADIGLFFR